MAQPRPEDPPHWIVEVLSPRTELRDQVLRDQVVKRDLYARHGVREYWIVDPDARTLVVYSGPEGSSRRRRRGCGLNRIAMSSRSVPSPVKAVAR